MALLQRSNLQLEIARNCAAHGVIKQRPPVKGPTCTISGRFTAVLADTARHYRPHGALQAALPRGAGASAIKFHPLFRDRHIS